ncbi:MAG: MBL fold metallo-hydrolase [Phycisphaerales bacterium]|nr:MBL fold metallo-hydrolase [Phycisphaerales bacterium]
MTWNWTVLRAGSLRLDGGSMFGVVPKALWSKLVEPDDANRIPLQTNCIYLTNGTNRVLIEAGFGGKWSDKERAIYALESRTVVDALREINVDPAELDHVIVSHLHFDHAGGLTHLDDTGAPTSSFPNATIIAQQTEWDDALANKSTMTRTYLRTHLDPIAPQMRCINGAGRVLDDLDVFPMPGHTWGQHAIRFRDADGTVCFPGDVMPTVNHVGLAFSLAYDMLPYENMLSKRMLLDRAVDESWRLVIDHEPGAPVVRVTRDAERPDRHHLVVCEDAPVR